MLLTDITVHIFDFISFCCCGRELKNVCDMIDMLALVSNSAVVTCC